MLKNKEKFTLTMVIISISFVSIILTGYLPADAQSPAARNRITICHRTASGTNPFVVIRDDVEGIVDAHLQHEQRGNGPDGDIIPEFTYLGKTYSRNLSTEYENGLTGAEILARGCNASNVIWTPTPTPPPPGPTPPPLPVPEPVTIMLFGAGLASIGVAVRRRFVKAAADEDQKDLK